MPSTPSLFLLGALFIFQVAARNNDTDLPECGQNCFANMSTLAPQLGCQIDDKRCLCTNENFGRVMRDCIGQSCPPDTNFRLFRIYGMSWCGDYSSVDPASNKYSSIVPTASSTPSVSSTTAQGQVTPTSTGSSNSTGPSNSTGSSTSTGSSNSTGLSDSQTTNDDDNTASSRGISTTGKIGLAIGMAALGVILIAGIPVLCSNRKRKRGGEEQAAPEVYMGDPRAPVNHNMNGRPPKLAELEGEKCSVQKTRALHKSLHEMPSPN